MRKAAQDLPRKLLNFNRKYRLARDADFQAVFAKPYKTTSQHLIALYIFNQLPHARLGLIIGKRYASAAVTRNWCRRVIRESFRPYCDRLAGLDIVVMLRSKPPTPKTADKQALRTEIDTLWQALLQKASSLPR